MGENMRMAEGEGFQFIVLTGAVCLGVCVLAAVLVAVYRRKTQKILRRINEMFDSAIDGSFTESHFDETVLSAVESKLWQYLSASESSARKTAQEKEKIKTLISDISHQTKTPISNILLYSELLAEQDLSKEAAEYAEKISSQSEKLSFLVNSLVKLSRLETGILTLNPRENRIAPMLAEIAAEYADRAAEKGLEFVLEPSDFAAVFDEKWTAEAIGNIVDNAIKYTESGSVHIKVKEYEMFVCVEVEDTGMGIAEEEQPKIFSRFYRSETTMQKSGVGIGLYLAREIIAGQKGYIKVSSKMGKGSVFSVFLSKQSG